MQKAVHSTKVLQWRWISIFLLGISGNTLVNAILDFKYQRALLSISLAEYIVSIIAAGILLEGTRWITMKLNGTLTWDEAPIKRLAFQLFTHFTFISIVSSTLLFAITYILYGNFHVLSDVFIVIISVVLLTFFFGTVDTGISFYKNWRNTIRHSSHINKETGKFLKTTLGKKQHLINPSEIESILSIQNQVYIYTTNGKRYPSDKSLDSLMDYLDSGSFFKINRQAVLKFTTIRSFKSLTHGKVAVTYSPDGKDLFQGQISRTKAASFRNWIREYTTQKTNTSDS